MTEAVKLIEENDLQRSKYVVENIKPEYHQLIMKYFRNCDEIKERGIFQINNILFLPPDNDVIHHSFLGPFATDPIPKEVRTKIKINPENKENIFFEFTSIPFSEVNDLSSFSVYWISTNEDIDFLNNKPVSITIFERFKRTVMDKSSEELFPETSLPHCFAFRKKRNVNLNTIETKFLADEPTLIKHEITFCLLISEKILYLSGHQFGGDPLALALKMKEWSDSILLLNGEKALPIWE